MTVKFVVTRGGGIPRLEVWKRAEPRCSWSNFIIATYMKVIQWNSVNSNSVFSKSLLTGTPTIPSPLYTHPT